MNITVQVADYTNKQHAQDIVLLMDNYAQDEMGGSEALTDDVKQKLVLTLSTIPHAFSVLCYVDAKPAGLATCFEAFSTFKCKPLINIHDLTVEPEYRRLGISQKLLEAVESVATQRDCCKVTLEVLEGNEAAKKSYLKYGFDGYELDPKMGKALFWQKML